MEVLENIVLGELPQHLKRLKTPLTSHVRVVIEDVERPASEVSQQKKKSKFTDSPLFGMWADREDMKDPAAYVRKIREPRYKDVY